MTQEEYNIIKDPVIRRFVDLNRDVLDGLGRLTHASSASMTFTLGDPHDDPYLLLGITRKRKKLHLALDINSTTWTISVKTPRTISSNNSPLVTLEGLNIRELAEVVARLSAMSGKIIEYHKKWYPACVDMISGRYPWLDGASLLVARQTIKGDGTARIQEFIKAFYKLRAVWLDQDHPWHQVRIGLDVRWDGACLGVQDVSVARIEVEVASCPDEVLTEVYRTWMTHKKLEAL